jgi:hypothetical protein
MADQLVRGIILKYTRRNEFIDFILFLYQEYIKEYIDDFTDDAASFIYNLQRQNWLKVLETAYKHKSN